MFGENYPYTNFHDLNLDWIIKTIKELNYKVDHLNNIIQVADPPNWSIASQYPESVIVFYDNRGYISIKPVPAGVPITDEDYWVPVIDMEGITIADPFDWDSETVYLTNTIVKYNDTVYIAKQNTAPGIAPTNTTYWNSLTYISPYKIKDYEYNNSYNMNDIVTRDNIIFLALQDVPAQTSLYNTDYWKPIYEPDIPEPHRIVNKQIAVYGDSWSTPTYGQAWIDLLSEVSGKPVHVVAQGSLPLSGVYNLFDNYDADIYIIEAGLNDCSLNTTADAFNTALAGFISAIRSVNAYAEIYFMTPPNIPKSDLLHQLFPIEFYRTWVWKTSGLLKFNVINGLKMTDLTYSDGVHPTQATSVNIGKHIIASIDTFGDEETHITEYTTLGRQTTDILFAVRNGQCFIRFQDCSISTDAGESGWEGTYTGTIDFTFMGLSALPSVSCWGYASNNAGQVCTMYLFSRFYSDGLLAVFSSNVGTILQPAEVEVVPVAWQKTLT